MQTYEKNNKLKYESKDSQEYVYQQIKEKVSNYLVSKNIPNQGNSALWFKIVSLFILLGLSYYSLIHSQSFLVLLLSFFAFGFTFLLIGINIGHDAAHHCVTGNKRIDNLLFQLIFGLQGLSGYMWQKRHNFSHHIFPNVYDNDTDLELSKYILLNPHQKKLPAHRYQHLYVMFMYMLFSLSWIFYVDFEMLFKKKHGNLKLGKLPPIEILKLIVIKLVYLFIFLVLPILLIQLPILYVLSAYIIMNFLVSIFLSLTFFISHHVLETEYAEAKDEVVKAESWIQHQITSTIDFSTESVIGNYIFGGFNLHIAHHIFPNVSHIHYPAITKIIKETLEENNLNWYKSFSFMEGVISHFSLLKKNGIELLKNKGEEEEMAIPQTI
jgi:linoleoyl-CoA desaturase